MVQQKTTELIVKTPSGLVQVMPKTNAAAVDYGEGTVQDELSRTVHITGAETVDGVKTFSKNTMTEAVALSGSEINVSLGSFFTKTVTADTAFTFTGAPSGKTCAFSLVLTNGGLHECTFPANVTWVGGQTPSLKTAGTDVLTFFTVNGGSTWMEVSTGGSSSGSGGTIADTGVVAGTYGPSANAAPAYGDSFIIPQITVNQKGQITQILEKTITIPASDNTDIQVQVVSSAWNKAYLLGVDAVNPISGAPLNVTSIADPDVYLTTSPGELHATTFTGNLNGTASRATADSTGANIANTYAKLASPALTGTPTAPTATAGTSTTQIATTAFVAEALSSFSGGIKDVAYLDEEPDSTNTADLDDSSFIFYEEGATNDASPNVVTTTGNQTITGVKTFVNGLYGGVAVLGANESAFNLSQATCFKKTVTADTTFSFTNVPSAVVCCITVVLVNGGSHLVTWPASVKWDNGNTPFLTANGTDVLTFITIDGGTTWFGNATCMGAAS